jgi:membrane protein YdbS with pleckstrin-like domain
MRPGPDQATVIHPHASYLTKLYIVTILVFCIFVLPFILLGLVPQLGWRYVVGFLLANAAWMVPVFALYPAYYRSISYELRENEVVVRKGVLTKSTKVVPYRTVTNLHLKRDLLDRSLFNLGTLNIETAGKSGEAGPEQSLVGLSDWEWVMAQVLERVQRQRGFAPATMAAEQTQQPDVLAALLAEVREIKQILLRK